MPTKRRKLAARPIGISAAALEAWHIGDFHTLNRELGIMPFMISPFDAVAYRPNPNDPQRNPHYGATWPRAMELRKALIAAAGPPGRVGRHGQPLGPARPRKQRANAN